MDFEAGNYETFRERAGVSGSTGPWSYSLGVSRLDFEGQFDNDEHNVTSVNARVGYALPNKGELSLTGRFQDGHLGIPFATVFPDFDPNREQDQQLWLLSLEWRQPWTSIWEHKLRVSAVDETLDVQGRARSRASVRLHLGHLHPGGSRPSGTTSSSPSRGTRSRSAASTGTRWARSRAATRRPSTPGPSSSRTSSTLFDRLYLTGGVRYDGNSAFEDKATARVALSYLVKATDTRLKASWGQGFRAPTFNELFFPAFAPCPPFGNPNLKPEESTSWDAGVEQHLWERRVRLAATYFRNDFTNLIQSTLTDPVNFCFQAQNVGKARSEGVEVEASVMPVDGLVLALAYTYTDSEDRTTGDPLRRVAPNALSVTATWEPLPGLTLSGRGAGDVEPVRGAGPAAEPRLHGRQRGGGVPAADQALGVPVEHHAAPAGDQPLQRELLRGGGLPGARDARRGRDPRHL